MAGNLEFREKLYLGESIDAKKVDKIKKKLRTKPFLSDVYLIVPAGNPKDQLDIFNARQLVQSHYADRTFYVLGIAADYRESLKLIEQMVQDCLCERGDCKLRDYLC